MCVCVGGWVEGAPLNPACALVHVHASACLAYATLQTSCNRRYLPRVVLGWCLPA